MALATGRQAALLEEQAAPAPTAAVALPGDSERPPGSTCRPAPSSSAGTHALERLATRDDVDLVVVGTGGIVSLRPVLAALAAGKIVATANKETLVAGGHLVMPLARRLAADVRATTPADPLASPLAWLWPIDSEHSAIWQCLAGEPWTRSPGCILTASGGPFLDATADELAAIKPDRRPAPSDVVAWAPRSRSTRRPS